MHDGTFGPTLCGKTTLAKARSREYFRQQGRRSIVFDPHLDDWGPHAWVTRDREAFRACVDASRSCEVWADEAAVTIARERDNMGLFTHSRHAGHRFHVLGHSGTDLLPGMRQQLSRLFLFRQPPSSAGIWAELFADERILECSTLEQFEFLDCELFKPPVRRKLRM